MQLILVRHAEAADIGQQGATTDFDRPLTPRGHQQARALAAALAAHGIVPAVVSSSPLLRAVQTAQPLPGLPSDRADMLTTTEFLSPEEYGPKRLSKYVTKLDAPTTVLVGHNPTVSDYARWLLNGEDGTIDLDKGSAVYIECPDGPGKGGGILRWLVNPDWFFVERPDC